MLIRVIHGFKKNLDNPFPIDLIPFFFKKMLEFDGPVQREDQGLLLNPYNYIKYNP